LAFECAPALSNLRKNSPEGKLTRACQKKLPVPTSGTMKFFALSAVALFLAAAATPVSAQTLATTPSDSSNEPLQALTKKIEEQNAKIDMLSQQILKLEQQLASARPGVMIGEPTPAPTTAATPEVPAHAGSGNAHIVARGETLTSIAKMHNVTVSDLVKANHIENDRKLQIGQSIIVPGPSTPSPSSSPIN
jgi:LysM repeat protein